MKKCFWPIAFCCVSLVILYLTRDWFYAKFLPERNSWIRGQIWLNLYFAAFCPLLLFFVWRMVKFEAEDLSPFQMLDHFLESRYLLPMVLLLQFVLILILHFVVFQGVPHLADESNYLFQAKILAAGHWTIEKPPMTNSFMAHFMFTREGQMFSAYPGGWPLLLSAGVLLGAPWLVNVLLSLCFSLCTFALARDLGGEKCGRCALLFTAFSPLQLVLASTFLNHTATMFFLCFFSRTCLKGIRKCSRGEKTGFWFWLAGFALGFAGITRPYTAFLFGVPWALHGLWRIWNEGPKIWLQHVALIFGALLPLMVLAFQNKAQTGSWDQMAFSNHLAEDTQLGFGASSATGEIFGLKQALLYSGLQLFMLCNQAQGLPLLSLIFAVPLFFRRGFGFSEKLLLTSTLFVMGGYFFYQFLSCLYGPRYLSETLAALLPLSALGFARILEEASLAKYYKVSFSLLGLWISCVLLFFACFWPHYSNNYLNENPSVAKMAEDVSEKPALIFFMEEKNEESPTRWEGLWCRNALDFKGDIVYARTKGREKDKALMSLYPGRYYYKLQYDTEGGKFELSKYE